MDFILGKIQTNTVPLFLCGMIDCRAGFDWHETNFGRNETFSLFFFLFSTMSDGDDVRLPAQRVRRQTWHFYLSRWYKTYWQIIVFLM